MIKTDDLWLDIYREAPVAAVNLIKTAHVRLHFRTCKDLTWTELNFGQKLLILNPVVALKGDFVDDGILDHIDVQDIALKIKRHIGKQSGRKQAFQCAVEIFPLGGIASLKIHVGHHGCRLYTFIALNADLADRGSRICP